MKKLIFTLFMIFALILSLPTQSSAFTNAKGVILDGYEIEMDMAPIIENGRTLVPLRGVLEAMGATVTWDQSTKTASAFFDGNSASVTINKFTAYANGYAMTLEVPAKIVNGRTMVPLRFMAEAIGYDVSFSDGWVYLEMPMTDDYSDFYTLLDDFDMYVAQPELANEDVNVTTFYSEELDSVVVSLESEGLRQKWIKWSKEEGFQREWKYYVNYMRELTVNGLDYFDNYGYDVDVMVEAVNDEDPDTVMLQIINGVVQYDEIGIN